MLSPRQRARFARNGFLRIPGAASSVTCDAIVRWTNARLPAGWLPRDPATWLGQATDACHSNTLAWRRGRLQYRIEDLKDDPALDMSFGIGSPVHQCALDLIGSALAPAKVRGLYPIFPVPEAVDYPPFVEGHIEAHPSQIITVTYANDVEPGGGALLVWPGSHRDVYPSMGSRLEHVGSDTFRATFKDWTTRQPVELPGRRGDVILIHHRLLHAPGVNRSSAVRYGFLCDYRRADFMALCERPPSRDVWEDWPAMKALPARDLNETCDFDLPVQTAPMPPGTDDATRLRRDPDRSRASSKRKGDASVLERMRVPGDRWLILSDAPVCRNDWKLFPRGEDLVANGLEVRIDGAPVASLCQYDFFARFPGGQGSAQIEVAGLTGPAWLRLVETRLPIARSRIAFCVELGPGSTRVCVDRGSAELLGVEDTAARSRSVWTMARRWATRR